jgi:hypothetical protein
MAEVLNLHAVLSMLQRKLRDKHLPASTISVMVGYTQNYALSVHEDLFAYHSEGQAKYLEEPARRHSRKIGQMVRAYVEQGMTFEQALTMGGLFLQRESQLLVPVDTGALRASAFTRLENEQSASPLTS